MGTSPQVRRSRCGRRMSGARRSNLQEQELTCRSSSLQEQETQPNSSSWKYVKPLPYFVFLKLTNGREFKYNLHTLSPHCCNKPCFKETLVAQTFFMLWKILMHLAICLISSFNNPLFMIYR